MAFSNVNLLSRLFHRLRIAQKIVLVFVLFVILPMVVTGGGLLRYVQDKAYQQTVAHMDNIANAIQANLGHQSSDLIIVARILADDTRLRQVLRQNDILALTQLLTEKRQSLDLDSVTIISQAEHPVAIDGNTLAMPTSELLVDAGWQGQTRSLIELSPPVLLGAVAPIRRAGEVTYLVLVSRRLPKSWIDDLSALSGAEISLIQAGQRVETSLLTPSGERSLYTDAFVSDPLAETPFYRHQLFGQNYYVRYEPLASLTCDDTTRLEIAVPPLQVTAITDSLNRSLWLVVVVGLIFGSLGAWILYHHLAVPLEMFRQAATDIAAGDLSKRLAVKRRDELGELGRAFNEMTYDLRRSHEKLLEVNRSLEALVAARTDELGAVLRSAGDAIVTLNSQGRIMSLNPAAEALLDCDIAHALHRLAGEIWIHEQSHDKNDNPGQDLTSAHRMLVTKKGRHVPVSVNRAPLRDHSGRQVGEVLIMRDITREYEIDRMKTEFVSLVSHELRSPLSSIRGYAELLLEGFTNCSMAQVQQWLQIIIGNTERLVALTNDILDIAHIESGRLSLTPSPAELPPLIESVAISMRPLLNSKEQSLEWHVSDDLPLVQIDRDRILQVFTNLVNNAAKYTPAGGHIALRTWRVESLAQGRHISADFSTQVVLPVVLVAVTDNGVGISEEDQQKLFTRFFRARHPATQDVKGTGLGLTITKLILEMHHSDIWVESRLGQGSTFFFTLPITIPALS